MRRRPSLSLVALVVEAQAAGAVGVPFVTAGRSWYRRLPPPSFAPPDAVFGPVWTVLYGLMAVSAHRVQRAPASADRTAAIGLHHAQLALNAAWTPLFFGARRPKVALADMVALLVTVMLLVRRAARVDKLAAALLVPYVAWLCFALALNAAAVCRR